MFSKKEIWILAVCLYSTFLVKSVLEAINRRENRKLTNELIQRQKLRNIEWKQRDIEREQRDIEQRQWEKEYHREKMKQLIWEREQREKKQNPREKSSALIE